jgi:hypothetical protein
MIKGDAVTFLDDIDKKVHEELKALALKHPTYETFMQDVQRLGEKMWHNARSQAEGDVKSAEGELVQDAEKDQLIFGDAATKPTPDGTTFNDAGTKPPTADPPAVEPSGVVFNDGVTTSTPETGTSVQDPPASTPVAS